MIGTLIALSLVVITGFVGQISVVQLTLAGVSGFTISHLAVNAGIAFPIAPLLGAGVALDPRPDHGGLGAARPRREPGRRHAGGGRRDRRTSASSTRTWGGGQTGSPVPEPKLLGLDLGPRAAVPRTRRQPAEPGLRLGRAGRDRVRCASLVGLPAPRLARAADARGALQRARRRRGGDQPAHGEARRVRHRSRSSPVVGRRAVRLQLRLGQRRPVRRVHRAEPDRVRLRRRHHADLRRGLRRPDLDAGAVPVRARQVARD